MAKKPKVSYNRWLTSFRLLGALLGMLAMIAFSSYSNSKDNTHYKTFVVVSNSISKSIGLRTVRAVLLDKQGRMWVGTQSGLFLFNGSENPRKPTISIKESYLWRSDIAAIKEDVEGDIWVLTANDGLYRFYEDDIPNAVEPEQYATSLRDAYSLEITSDFIWIIDASGLSSLRLVLKVPESLHRVHESTELMTNIAKTNQEGICVGENRRVLCWRRDGIFENHYIIPPAVNDTEYVARLTAISHSDQEGSIILGTTRGELLILSRSNRTVSTVCQIDLGAIATVTAIKRHSIGIIVGTDKGLVQISDNGTDCSEVRVLNSQNAHVTNSYEFGSHLWVTTYTGVHTITPSPFSYFSSSNSTINDEVMSFESAEHFGTFVGTYNGLFFQAVGEEDFAEIILPASEGGHTNKRVMALESDGERLWIGLRDGGILWFDLSKRQFVRSPNELAGMSVTTMERISASEMLIGTYGDGLWLFSSGESPETRRIKLEPFSRWRNITVIHVIDDKTVFVAAEFNARFLCNESKAWSVCKRVPRITSLAKSRILSAAITNTKEDLWIGTQNDGLYRYHLDAAESWIGEKVNLGAHDSKSIFSLIETTYGGLWLGTSNGLINYRPADEEKLVFFAQDGLQDNDFNYGAALSAHDGQLYFGGSNGFNRFNPNQFEVGRRKPKIHFSQIQIGTERSATRYDPSDSGTININYLDYFIRIFFHIPDFIDSQGVRFRYKLHPFDPTWIDGGNDGSATYTNIPPGDYVFHVQGANSAGVWNREGISMNLRVLPPVWRTWWAYCIYALTACFLLYIGKKWYDSNVLRVKATEMAREKTRDADAALDAMQEQLEAQDSFVRNVRQRNIATLDTVRELIDHRAKYIPDDLYAEIMRGTGAHVHALALLERSLKYYNDRLFADLNAFSADCLSDFCHEYASRHDVTTINEVTHELVPAEDATMLALIIHELLQNAFLHAFNGEQGSKYLRIILVFRKGTLHNTASQIELKVQDNGSGIPDGVSGELPGLSLVQKIVRHYDGEMETTCLDGSAITIVLRVPASKPT